MDKPYSTLKSALILFCLLLGTAGCALLVLGLLASNFLNSHNVQSVSVGVVWLYILAGSCILLSCLGVCGAYKEKKLLLRLFLGAMLGGSFSLFIFGMHGITVSAQLKEGLSGSSMPDVVRAIMANEQLRTNLKVLEAKLGCCGLTGPSDWETDGGHVSDSCLCPSEEQEDTLRCANTTYKTYSRYLFNGREEITHTVSIYKEPCGPVLLEFVDRSIKVILGITFGFAITAMVGVMLSLSLIYSMGATEQQSGSNSNIPFHRFA